MSADRIAGWDAKKQEMDFDNIIPEDLNIEIDQAFANCDYNLRHAGGKSWSQVYKIVTYTTDVPATHGGIVEKMKKWMPDHMPVWTELGLKVMRFEIDVAAYDA